MDCTLGTANIGANTNFTVGVVDNCIIGVGATYVRPLTPLKLYFTTASLAPTWLLMSGSQPDDFSGQWDGVTGSAVIVSSGVGFVKTIAPLSGSKLNRFLASTASGATFPPSARTPYSTFVAGPFTGTIPAGTWTINASIMVSDPFYKVAQYSPIFELWWDVWRCDDLTGLNPSAIVSQIEYQSPIQPITNGISTAMTSSNVGAITMANQYLFLTFTPGTLVTVTSGSFGDATKGRLDPAIGSGSYLLTPGLQTI